MPPLADFRRATLLVLLVGLILGIVMLTDAAPTRRAIAWTSLLETAAGGVTNPKQGSGGSKTGSASTNVAPSIAELTITSPINENAAPSYKGVAITEYTIPTSNSFPNGIVLGPDGALWFTETLGRRIGRITTNGTLTEYPVSAGTNLQGITVGPDGRTIWFTIQGNARIGRITTNGVVTQFPLTAGRTPQGITAVPSGRLWFAELFNTRIGSMTTNGAVNEYLLQTGATPYGITYGPDGALWYTDFFSDKIGRITTSGVVTQFSLIPFSSPAQITSGPDGALWFTQQDGHAIGRITTAGVTNEYALGFGTSPLGITTGPDNAIWFTEVASKKIGRLTTNGVITKLALAPGGPQPDSGPLGIATGSDGALWFTVANRNRIGRLGFATSGNVLLSGTIDDPNNEDSHTLTVNWGDGTAPEVFTYAPGIIAVNITHQYTGTHPSYTVNITVSDGLQSTTTNTQVVINLPRITSINGLQSDQVVIQGTATPGRTYLVQASLDLTLWMIIGDTTANESGTFTFEEPAQVGVLRRFYRLVVPDNPEAIR